jgi:hypothetical protein
MNTGWYHRLARLFVGPVAVAAVIGGAMGMSAIAHTDTAPMATQPTQASYRLGGR